MEDALRVANLDQILLLGEGLNPCSNGRCSASDQTQNDTSDDVPS